jgi:hypothetical protein
VVVTNLNYDNATPTEVCGIATRWRGRNQTWLLNDKKKTAALIVQPKGCPANFASNTWSFPVRLPLFRSITPSFLHRAVVNHRAARRYSPSSSTSNQTSQSCHWWPADIQLIMQWTNSWSRTFCLCLELQIDHVELSPLSRREWPNRTQVPYHIP